VTPLHLAAEKGHLEIANALIAADAMAEWPESAGKITVEKLKKCLLRRCRNCERWGAWPCSGCKRGKEVAYQKMFVAQMSQL
jgi:ankyrin repeat protein